MLGDRCSTLFRYLHLLTAWKSLQLIYKSDRLAKSAPQGQCWLQAKDLGYVPSEKLQLKPR